MSATSVAVSIGPSSFTAMDPMWSMPLSVRVDGVRTRGVAGGGVRLDDGRSVWVAPKGRQAVLWASRPYQPMSQGDLRGLSSAGGGISVDPRRGPALLPLPRPTTGDLPLPIWHDRPRRTTTS